jgi:hypothetical protein
VTVATGGSPRAIAVDSNNVYWTDVANGTIDMAPVGGGPSVTLATGQVSPLAIATDGSYVYWVDGGLGTVMRCAVTGCASPTKLWQGTSSSPEAIAVDLTNAYFTTETVPPKVWSVPKAGGSAGVIGVGATDAIAAAIDGSRVYWTDRGVSWVPLTGGTASVLASSSTTGTGITLDALNVYWTGSDTLGRGVITRVPKAGGTTTSIMTDPAGTPNGVAVDAARVYWTAHGPSENTVNAVPVGGGTTTVLASAQGNPWGIALDAHSVYWTNLNGSVMRVAKP